MRKIAVFLFLASATALARPLELADQFKVWRLGDVAVSPDGRLVAFTSSTQDREANSRRVALYVMPAAGGAPQLVTSAGKVNEAPRWAPDGRTLAFTSDREKDTPQIFVVEFDAAGKPGGERRVTDIADGASSPQWSRDGRWLVFVSEVQVDKRPPGVKWHEAHEGFPRHWKVWRDGKRQHLFVVPAAGGPARDVTPGDQDSPTWRLLEPIDYAFTPDSRGIVYLREGFAVAIIPGEKKVYVAGQRANQLFVVDATARKVVKTIAVGSEPTAIVTAHDGSAAFVVNHQSATVSKIDPGSDTVVATLPVGESPWGAALSADGKLLYVTEFLLDAGVIVVDTKSFSVVRTLKLPDQDPGSDKRLPNGQPRGAYAAVPRPGDGALWIAHLLLAVKTAQPDLDFESTVFPTISRAAPDGSAQTDRLLFKPGRVPGASGAFFDSVSGPRALAFTPDGKFALLALSQSEDVMVFDGQSGNEVGLVRPVGGSLLEGIVVDHAGKHAFVDARNTHDIIALAIDPTNSVTPVAVDGAPIERLAGADPMPTQLRLGQQLFYSANSATYPLTQNFWVACSSCHLEGGTDAVTWLFAQGPRDTPSNVGGTLHTGFLFRQAVRSSLLEYDDTINTEQGGAFNRNAPAQVPLLTALGAYVNQAIPFPQNPNRLPGGLDASQTHGQALFTDHCASCHAGDYLTDSGAGNPTLDRANGPILLHDIGTCVTSGPHPDMPSTDKVTMQVHDACQFDTPTLRSIFASPPYFHDGSARTLEDAVDRLDFISTLSAQDKADLVAYVKTL